MTSNETPSPLPPRLMAFAGFRHLVTGERPQVIAALRKLAPDEDALIRVFDDATGERIDLDLRPHAYPGDDANANLGSAALAVTPSDTTDTPVARPVGRPKLGVVAREVTLLPRHWEWLSSQPGGASVTLRRLVDETRKGSEGRVSARTARDNAYRFMSEMGGDLAGFEEATRALFAGDRTRFESLVATWPEDVRLQLVRLATASWNFNGSAA